MKSLESLIGELDYILQSPSRKGSLELITVRPKENERLELKEGHITKSDGVEGDNWKFRKSRHTPDGSPDPETQINIMNARVIDSITSRQDEWKKAGDQLFVNFDITEKNLPAGSQFKIGNEVVLEVSAQPHTGCGKFKDRFGPDALKFVNHKDYKELRLRGINAFVIQEGTVRPGDEINKIS
ncbi:MAG TPA: MOSC domain-containing protein [Flavobacteriales bacterium]|jgi:hypothetical protein|nr:MOSC domain-containing protein [Flavobacteriales bacterium]